MRSLLPSSPAKLRKERYVYRTHEQKARSSAKNPNNKGFQNHLNIVSSNLDLLVTIVMPKFKVVLIEHGYATTECERQIVESAGGQFIDAEKLPLEEALCLCEEAEGIFCRRLEVTAALLKRFRRCKI